MCHDADKPISRRFLLAPENYWQVIVHASNISLLFLRTLLIWSWFCKVGKSKSKHHVQLNSNDVKHLWSSIQRSVGKLNKIWTISAETVNIKTNCFWKYSKHFNQIKMQNTNFPSYIHVHRTTIRQMSTKFKNFQQNFLRIVLFLKSQRNAFQNHCNCHARQLIQLHLLLNTLIL